VTLYDITRAITPGLAVWPGDTPYASRSLMRISEGDACNLTTLTLSAHTGTHADAPYHFDASGQTIGQVVLERYLGPATVVALPALEGALFPEHLNDVDLERVERLLIHTQASTLPDGYFPKTFVYPAPETAKLLVEHQVKLFGTDSPSVDPLTSETLEAHKVFCRGGVALLEGLQLQGVPPGEYELIALPLKLDGDGSPVRAVLRSVG